MSRPQTSTAKLRLAHHRRKRLLQGTRRLPAAADRTAPAKSSGWDAAPAASIAVDALEEDSFQTFRSLASKWGEKQAPLPEGCTDEALLQDLGLLCGGKPARAAVLLFHEKPSSILPGCQISLSQSKNNFPMLEEETLDGPLASIADQLLALTYDRYGRYGPKLCTWARMAVFTALANNDYASGRPVEIFLGDDGISVSCSCVLPEGWTAEDLLKSYTAAPFNPLLARTFCRGGFFSPEYDLLKIQSFGAPKCLVIDDVLTISTEFAVAPNPEESCEDLPDYLKELERQSTRCRQKYRTSMAIYDFAARPGKASGTNAGWDAALEDSVSREDLDCRSFAILRDMVIAWNGMDRGEDHLPVLTNTDLLCCLSLLDDERDEKLKRAAVLLFHRNPSSIFPGCFVRLSYVDEDSKLHEETLKDSFLSIAQRLIHLTLDRYELYDGDLYICARKLAFTAFVNNNYASGRPIEIFFGDREISVKCSCRLPKGWTPEKLITSYTERPYNPVIAAAFCCTGFFYPDEYDLQKKRGFGLPKFAVQGDVLTLSLEFSWGCFPGRQENRWGL